jgi:hypothetical protein
MGHISRLPGASQHYVPSDARLAPLLEAQEGGTISSELYALVGVLHGAFALEMQSSQAQFSRLSIFPCRITLRRF